MDIGDKIMNTYQTTAMVGEHGQLQLAGVPFEPGSEVEVVIRQKPVTEESRTPMRELFARVRARNTESVGPLNREELYDRKVLR